MSYPADGKPRFVVGSSLGGSITLDGAPDHSARPEAYIYDRAYCHRIVGRVRRITRAQAESDARAFAAMLEEGRDPNSKPWETRRQTSWQTREAL